MAEDFPQEDLEELMGMVKPGLFKVDFYHNEEGNGIFKQSNIYFADTPEEKKKMKKTG